MEYIEGRDLDHLIRECGAFPVEQALDCVMQAARGLEAAHARGIIHRDIKPANLMLDSSGTVRVLDLGLARLVGDTSTFGQNTPHHLTRPGIFMGTVDFMAPEQAEDSHNVDHRADIYSLGCSLYFLLSARPPFGGATVISRLMAHQDQPPPSIRATRPEVSDAVDAAYLAMMAKRPDDRPQSMADVIAVLDLCRLAGSGAKGNAPLHSFSSTVLQFATPLKERSSPTVFIARGESGGFRFEAGPEIEMPGLADRSGGLTESARRGASFRGRFSRRRSKPWLARACRAGLVFASRRRSRSLSSLTLPGCGAGVRSRHRLRPPLQNRSHRATTNRRLHRTSLSRP